MDWTITPGLKSAGEIVTLNGDFDLYEGPRFASEISVLIRGGQKYVVLDFSGVEYLDSCGVGVIIKLLQLMRSTGGVLRFQGIHGTPRRVLQMSNILSLLQEQPRSEGAS
jgi:anti-sigma B factor antagonist